MRFDPPLQSARLIRRYKRFLADIKFDDGTTSTAHCPNPGSMMGLAEPGVEVWVSKSTNPKRKLGWSWELVATSVLSDDTPSVLVGIHTSRANDLAKEAIEAGHITELNRYDTLHREQRYGENSRIDLLLENSKTDDNAWVEVKSVTLSRQAGVAEFPDAVTSRGKKHLSELGRLAREGKRAVMLYVIQRNDCTKMCLANDIDPTYAKAAQEATQAGVEMLCYDCYITPDDITLHNAIPLII
ncbi:MAG: DNA/RNA nuclease SfsA [Parvularculales bacterium]